MSSRINRLRVSTKLMLVNAAILISILVLTSLLTVAGLYFSVYHQAEMDLQYSINEVETVFSCIARNLCRITSIKACSA